MSAPTTIFALPEWLPHLGGLATFYAHLARCRSQQGLKTTILTTQKAPVDPEWPGVSLVSVVNDKNAHFVRLCQMLPEGWEVAALSLATGQALADWLRKNAPADAVVFAAEFLGYASALCAPDLPPLVVTAHGSLGQIAARSPDNPPTADLALLRQLESDALLRAPAVSAYSPANAVEWTNALSRNVPSIDPPFFLSQDLDTHPLPKITSRSTRTRQHPLVGVVLGRLQNWKGARVLADALERIGPDAPLRIDWYGGDTNSAPDGVSMAQWLGENHPRIFGKTFNWCGPVARETALRHQREADFALVPSCWDTLNFTVLEAMDAARPVLVSTGAGASYLIDSGRNGLLFAVDDADALADSLQEALGEPNCLENLGASARATLAERCAPETCVARYATLAEQARQTDYDLKGDGAAEIFLPLLDALASSDRLPRHSGRDLFTALTRKIGQRLGIDFNA